VLSFLFSLPGSLPPVRTYKPPAQSFFNQRKLSPPEKRDPSFPLLPFLLSPSSYAFLSLNPPPQHTTPTTCSNGLLPLKDLFPSPFPLCIDFFALDILVIRLCPKQTCVEDNNVLVYSPPLRVPSGSYQTCDIFFPYHIPSFFL